MLIAIRIDSHGVYRQEKLIASRLLTVLRFLVNHLQALPPLFFQMAQVYLKLLPMVALYLHYWRTMRHGFGFGLRWLFVRLFGWFLCRLLTN